MKDDSGIILVNVLVALAIGSAITVLMITSQDTLLDRNARAAAANQAEALVIGAETAVQVALQRDMIIAPQSDHFEESWAQAAQRDISLATGEFSVNILDAQSRFNLNGLINSDLQQAQILSRLVRDLGLTEMVASKIITEIRSRGPMVELREINGLNASEIDLLRPHVSFLPIDGDVNLNTADAIVMAAVLGNFAAARQLIKTRDRNGFLTQSDLTNVGVLAASGAGFTSQLFDVFSVAEVDNVTVTLQSRILRRSGVGFQEAVVIERKFGTQ